MKGMNKKQKLKYKRYCIVFNAKKELIKGEFIVYVYKIYKCEFNFKPLIGNEILIKSKMMIQLTHQRNMMSIRHIIDIEF
jgi:hypothetical protein